MAFDSVKGLLAAAKNQKLPLWEVILNEDLRERNVRREDSLREMRGLWQAMCRASENYDGALRSASGLSGGDGAKMEAYCRQGDTVGGGFLAEMIAQALKMGESNACMKRIVAAPTAGSCGVLPAVLLPMARRGRLPEEALLHAMYVAAAFGQVIATRATIAGSEGGCQAEVGAASGMAAAAVVCLRGGTPDMCAQACAMALKNLLGLACDPVAGLVEVPCVKRNVVGAVNAVSSADMALAGIRSRIPPDEVIDAMRAIGAMMPAAIRETADGGLAATPTALAAAKRLAQQK